MGGPQGEKGEKGDQGSIGPKGIGIRFVTYDATAGNLKMIDDENKILLDTNIRGPKGPPGTYTAEQVATEIINDDVFIDSLAEKTATKDSLSTKISPLLVNDTLFRSDIQTNLSNSGQFANLVGNSIGRNQSFISSVSNNLGSLITEQRIGPIVSPRTIWCDANNSCLLPTGGTLIVRTGYRGKDGAVGQPIVLSDRETGGFKHFIQTRHGTDENSIRFWINTGADATASSAPGTGNKNPFTIRPNAIVVNNKILGEGASGPLEIDPNYTTNNFVKIWDGLEVEGRPYFTSTADCADFATQLKNKPINTLTFGVLNKNVYLAYKDSEGKIRQFKIGGEVTDGCWDSLKLDNLNLGDKWTMGFDKAYSDGETRIKLLKDMGNKNYKDMVWIESDNPQGLIFLQEILRVGIKTNGLVNKDMLRKFLYLVINHHIYYVINLHYLYLFYYLYNKIMSVLMEYCKFRAYTAMFVLSLIIMSLSSVAYTSSTEKNKSGSERLKM